MFKLPQGKHLRRLVYSERFANNISMVKIHAAERTRRLDRVMDLLACKTTQQVEDTAVAEFGVRRFTAQRYIREAQRMILALIEVPRSEWIANTLLQLDQIIRTGDIKDRLAAISQRTALLGLQTPARVHVLVEGIYRGPEQLAALGDPRLLKQALALEAAYDGTVKGNGNGDQAREPHPLAEHPGPTGSARLPAPEPPPNPPEGGADFTNLR